jgi:hypothetical protein
MAVQPFASHDDGYRDLVAGTADFLNGNVAAILVDHSLGAPDRATMTQYSHVSASECTDVDYSQQVVGTKGVTVVTTRVRITHGKITFTAQGDVTGRYVFYIFGTAGTLNTTDKILGHVDLTGDANASSTNAEFSFTPSSSGLWEIDRSAGV